MILQTQALVLHFKTVMGTYVNQNIVKQRLSRYVRPYWSNTQRTYGGFSDSRYYLPDYTELQNMLAQNPVFSSNDLGEGFDCDDYSFVLKGSFSLYGKNIGLEASICLGIAWGLFNWRSEFHSCNWILLDNFTFWWVEPSNKNLHEVHSCRGGLTLMLV